MFKETAAAAFYELCLNSRNLKSSHAQMRTGFFLTYPSSQFLNKIKIHYLAKKKTDVQSLDVWLLPGIFPQ